MEFGIDNTQHGRYAVVAVRGEVDALTSPQLRRSIEELVSDGQAQLVLDLREVKFLDSSALSVLVSGRKQVQAEGGDLTLVCTEPRILQLFQITNLEDVFTIHDSVEAATSG
ncbi:MAG: anti-sigma factor antagonist [Actinomycetota bacterium]|jgi:anti-sigma B factor antagonist